MDEPHLFDPGPETPVPTPERMSPDRRRTLRNRQMLDKGIHPATGRPLTGDGRICRDCPHILRVQHRGPRTWFKCVRHRLGMSHSAASDIRAGWPACVLIDHEETTTT